MKVGGQLYIQAASLSLVRSIIDPEDGGIIFLRNVRKITPDNTSDPKYESSPQCKPLISSLQQFCAHTNLIITPHTHILVQHSRLFRNYGDFIPDYTASVLFIVTAVRISYSTESVLGFDTV
jgi:hypothetical protein